MPDEKSLVSDPPAVSALKSRLARFETEEGRLRGVNFKPRESDVFITTSPKCGTTWMQQIVHQLRTGGSMEFDEICQVVPWVELAADLNIDLQQEQVHPRCFKTHLWEPSCPKGAKYIVIFRNPVDAAVSFYNFFNGWFFPSSQLDEMHIEVDDFIEHFVLRRGKPINHMVNASIWDFMISWLPYSKANADRVRQSNERKSSEFDDIKVLPLFFEDMKEDLEAVVKIVAQFIGVKDEDGDLIKKVVEMSSFKYMKEHEDKFDENVTKRFRNEAMGLPRDAGMTNSKVSGVQQTANKVQMSSEMMMKLEQRWKDSITTRFGYETYDDLRRSLGLVSC